MKKKEMREARHDREKKMEKREEKGIKRKFCDEKGLDSKKDRLVCLSLALQYIYWCEKVLLI